MLGVRAGGQDAGYLGAGQQLRDALGALGHDQLNLEGRPIQHLQIEKAHRIEIQPATRPGQPALLGQVDKEGL